MPSARDEAKGNTPASAARHLFQADPSAKLPEYVFPPPLQEAGPATQQTDARAPGLDLYRAPPTCSRRSLLSLMWRRLDDSPAKALAHLRTLRPPRL